MSIKQFRLSAQAREQANSPEDADGDHPVEHPLPVGVVPPSRSQPTPPTPVEPPA